MNNFLAIKSEFEYLILYYKQSIPKGRSQKYYKLILYLERKAEQQLSQPIKTGYLSFTFENYFNYIKKSIIYVKIY
jgi:hypothetical protein